MIQIKTNIDLTSAKWKNAFPRYRKKIGEAVALACLQAKKPAALKERAFDINIILTTDANIKKLNKNYKGKDKPTNVLSFPQIKMEGLKKSDLKMYPQEMIIPLGDIIIAHQITKKEAKAEQKEFEAHVMHLVIHGVLHLLGYDHKTKKAAELMEKLEVKLMKALDYPNPYEVCSTKLKH